MKNRPPESRVWRNLVVLPSMDVINAEMMTDLGMSIENFSSLQNELRSAIVEKQFDPDASFSLWQHALSRIASTLDRQSRDNFEAWGMGFPCDSDSALPELDAWERVWPELANALRSSQSSAPWGEEIARTYRQDARNSEFERKLEERLTHPLSEWDKRCLSHYSNEDLMSETEFFTALTLGSDRLQLARFWKTISDGLSAEQKEIVWSLASDIWTRSHDAMTDSDLKAMRAEFQDELSFQNALTALQTYNPKPPQLPHPDILLSYL